jgi:sugar phosphate isomerase/epimerase
MRCIALAIWIALACVSLPRQGDAMPRAAAQLYGWMSADRLSKEDCLKQARKAGFRAVEGWLDDFASDADAEHFRRILIESDLTLASLYSGAHLHHADKAEETVKVILERAKRATVFPGLIINVNCEGPKTDGELATQARYLNRLGEELQKLGMTLAIHNHTPEMADGAREYRAMLAQTDKRFVSFCLDLHWCVKSGQDPYEMIRLGSGRLASVHLRNGTNRTWSEWLGEGTDIDHEKAKAELEKAGFDGWLILELAYEGGTKRTIGQTEDAERSLRYIEKVWFPPVEGHTAFGGWLELRRAPIGHFYPEQIDGRWWLIDPHGGAFIAKAVNHVSFTADSAPSLGHSPYERAVRQKYGSEENWAKAACERLRGWGFNCIGGWSSASTFEQGMPYTVILDLAAGGGADWQRGTVADFFSKRFVEGVQRRARERCAPRAADPNVLGYFTDNELRWGPDWRSRKGLLEEYLAFAPSAEGKAAVIDHLLAQHKTAEAVSKLLGLPPTDRDGLLKAKEFKMDGDVLARESAGFLRAVAEQYFSTCYKAIKLADPNHLVLGCRFAGYAPREVVEGSKGWVDVVSYNNYDADPPAGKIQEIYGITGRPMMLTEFSFKAMDSGLPNTKGAGRPLPTQEDRADSFDRYVNGLMDLPMCVGSHWFEHSDEPKEGRFDGENSNYGVVNINDEPWEVLTRRMTEVNAGLEKRHSSSK